VNLGKQTHAKKAKPLGGTTRGLDWVSGQGEDERRNGEATILLGQRLLVRNEPTRHSKQKIVRGAKAWATAPAKGEGIPSSAPLVRALIF